MKVIIPEKVYSKPIEDLLVFCDCEHAIYRFTLYADEKEDKKKKTKRAIIFTMVEVYTQSLSDMNDGRQDDTPGIDISLADMDRILQFLKKERVTNDFVEVTLDCLSEYAGHGAGLRVYRRLLTKTDEELTFTFFPWEKYGDDEKIKTAEEYCDIIVEEPQRTEFIKEFELMCERAHAVAEQYKGLGWEVVNAW